MKLLGHVYVATKCFPGKNQQLLAFGAIVPETVFYTKDPALSFDQIHEGGLELYYCCKEKNPSMCDLAIGSMTHSVKYGADNYNSLESLEPLGFRESDIPKIADALEIEMQAAKARAHNLYDLVLDYYINLNYPNIKDLIEETKNLDKHNIARTLSMCFNVSEQAIYFNLVHLWDKYDLELIESFEGLAKLWRSLASDLKEKDPVNIKKTAELLSNFYARAEPSADEFLTKVINSAKQRVNEAINY